MHSDSFSTTGLGVARTRVGETTGAALLAWHDADRAEVAGEPWLVGEALPSSSSSSSSLSVTEAVDTLQTSGSMFREAVESQRERFSIAVCRV